MGAVIEDPAIKRVMNRGEIPGSDGVEATVEYTDAIDQSFSASPVSRRFFARATTSNEDELEGIARPLDAREVDGERAAPSVFGRAMRPARADRLGRRCSAHLVEPAWKKQ